MPELNIILDRLTGQMFAEAHTCAPVEALGQLVELSGLMRGVACAAPLALLAPPVALAEEISASVSVRVSGYYHNSLIEGPGRRSSAKLQGCPLRCSGCFTPDSWDPREGVAVPVGRLAEALLDPTYERDGVSIHGGEPFSQPEGLLALVTALRERGCAHILVYSGYTYEHLQHMAEREPTVGIVLREIDMLVDGPYMEALAESAGPWTGSGNQRVIDLAATRRAGAVVLPRQHLERHEVWTDSSLFASGCMAAPENGRRAPEQARPKGSRPVDAKMLTFR